MFVDLHDATVAHVSQGTGDDGASQVTVVFSAVFVTASPDELEGEYRPARLRLEDASWSAGAAPTQPVGELEHGWWQSGSGELRYDFAAFPSEAGASLRVVLQRAEDAAQVVLMGSRATFELTTLSLEDCPQLGPADRNMLRALLDGSDSLDIARDYRLPLPEIDGRLDRAFAELGITGLAELRKGFHP